jgi:hypothetical protein
MNARLNELRVRYPWPLSVPDVPAALSGWFGESHERVLGRRLSSQTRLVVELGSWLGLSTRFLLRNAPGATVVAIDHWKGSREHHAEQRWREVLPTLYETFLVNCQDYSDRLVPMRTTTLLGLAELAELGLTPDLVYVDASHETEDVLADLLTIARHWPEATIVGDDWRWDSVRVAVEQFAAQTQRVVRVDDTVWTLESASCISFSTLAIHAPYRMRAKLLARDLERWLPDATLVVLTDETDDFAEHPNVHAVGHSPTGPMAADYLRDPGISHGGGGAYHDKRFALAEALRLAPTATLLDADSRMTTQPAIPLLGPGLAVAHGDRETVLDHLLWCGPRRLPAFIGLARHLGDESLLERAWWCQESLLSVTKDGAEDRFVEAWGVAGDYLQSRGVFSGEGGVIGIAAAMVGWDPDFAALDALGAAVVHEKGGPKAT